jgi:hypothetical protein
LGLDVLNEFRCHKVQQFLSAVRWMMDEKTSLRTSASLDAKWVAVFYGSVFCVKGKNGKTAVCFGYQGIRLHF